MKKHNSAVRKTRGGPPRSAASTAAGSTPTVITGALQCTKTALPCLPDVRKGRRLPQDVLTAASHNDQPQGASARTPDPPTPSAHDDAVILIERDAQHRPRPADTPIRGLHRLHPPDPAPAQRQRLRTEHQATRPLIQMRPHELVPTGYILISHTGHIAQTEPLPQHKTQLIDQRALVVPVGFQGVGDEPVGGVDGEV